MSLAALPHRRIAASLPPPGHCLWPIQDIDSLPLLWCGAKAVPRYPYCAAHWRRAYLDPATEEPYSRDASQSDPHLYRRRVL